MIIVISTIKLFYKMNKYVNKMNKYSLLKISSKVIHILLTSYTHFINNLLTSYTQTIHNIKKIVNGLLTSYTQVIHKLSTRCF